MTPTAILNLCAAILCAFSAGACYRGGAKTMGYINVCLAAANIAFLLVDIGVIK